MNLKNSAFKMPLAPPPNPPSEALLFHDILEEKTLTLRNIMNDFLQVQPYRKFENEFSNFVKRTKQIMLEGQRNGANMSRLTNSSQIVAMNSRPSSSFNYRPSTTMSTINSNRNSTLRLPDNHYQPVVQLNPFKPPTEFQPVVLPPINQSFYSSRRSSLCNTVITVNQLNNDSGKLSKANSVCEISQYSESSKNLHKSHLDIPNTYSDITIAENRSVNSLPQIENDDDDDDDDAANSIESLMENVGFKIIVGMPNNTKNKTPPLCENAIQNNERFLSKWSLNLKRLQLSSHLVLTGTLLEQDQFTVKEKLHDAGILLARKSATLVRTKNGLYHLIGNIIGGSPNDLYQLCLAINGVPKNWRNSLKKINTKVGKGNKNTILDFSLDSPAGPIKPKQAAILNMSITRNGKSYNINSTRTENKKNNGKRKSTDVSDNDTNNQRKHRKFHEKLPPLLASTPKRAKSRPSVFQTPTQILKNKFRQNINNQTNGKSNTRTLNTHNDSIKVNKKRHSNSKEQTNILLESTKSVEETSLKSKSNTSKKQHSKQVIESIIADSVNNLKRSKQQISINSSNSNITQSKSKTSGNSTKMFNSNSTASRSKLKTSVNSTKNSSVDNGKKSKPITPTGQRENIQNRPSPSQLPNMNKEAKTVKEMITRKEKKTTASKELKTKQKKCSKPSSSAEMGIFDDVDFAEYGVAEELNIMMSPSKLSVTSHTDKSRSATPPLYSNQWGAVGKSIVVSEPPTPLSKSVEAIALKRVKQPKITVDEQLRNLKRTNKKQANYKLTTDKLNKMLEYGTEFSDSDN